MLLPCLFSPSFFQEPAVCPHGFRLVPARTAQSRVAKVGVVGGELRLWPAQSGGRRPGDDGEAGAVDPRVEKRGRRRTRVPGLVAAGGSGNRHPDSRRWRAAGTRASWTPSTCCCWWPSYPWQSGGPSGRGRLDPGEGEGLLLLPDCIWAAPSACRDSVPRPPTWAGSGSGQSRGPPALRPEELGLCVLARVPRWPPGGLELPRELGDVTELSSAAV